MIQLLNPFFLAQETQAEELLRGTFSNFVFAIFSSTCFASLRRAIYIYINSYVYKYVYKYMYTHNIHNILNFDVRSQKVL